MAQTQTAIANVRSRQQWAEIISADWRKSIDSVIQTGRDLAHAKAELPHGQFERMVRDDLPFSDRAAQQLMAIANHPLIGKAQTTALLPPSWSVLSELTKLSEHDFADAQERGLITSDTGAREARAVANAYGTSEGQTVGDPNKQSMLPSPQKAREIAQATNRIVAASDGNLYTGSSDKEVGEYITRRRHVFGVREAIERIADCDLTPREWVEGSERHWLSDFRPRAIDDAIEWLTAAKEALGIIDA